MWGHGLNSVGGEEARHDKRKKNFFCITDNQIDDSNSMQLLTHYEYYSLPLHTTITTNTTTTTATRALRTGWGVCGTTNSSSSLSGDGSVRVKKGFEKKRAFLPAPPPSLPPPLPPPFPHQKMRRSPLSIPLVLVAALRGGE